MTPETIQRIQSSWALVRPVAKDAMDFFFDSLFARDPALKPLFKSDIEKHKIAFQSTLGMAIAKLDQPETLIPVLENLGARHTGYGVQKTDYETAGFVLIDTLSVHLGTDFDAETEAAWVELLTLVAATMTKSSDADKEASQAAA